MLSYRGCSYPLVKENCRHELDAQLDLELEAQLDLEAQIDLDLEA